MNKQKTNQNILKQEVKITNKTLQNLFNISMFLGSIGFLLTGISSYINKTLLILFEGNKVLFFPQGLTMMIYGILGLLISINQIILTLYKVGEGYNEFNKENGKVTIFRKGIPGQKKDIELFYSLNDIVRDDNL